METMTKNKWVGAVLSFFTKTAGFENVTDCSWRNLLERTPEGTDMHHKTVSSDVSNDGQHCYA